jgi:hypothetical protein
VNDVFEDPETRRKRWTLIALGTVIGAAVGFMIGRLPLGAFAGYIAGIILGIAKYGNPQPETPEQKKTMRLASWSLSATVILGALMYSSFSGDYLSGVGGGIGLVFSVGLSFGTLYDERLGRIFSKAARNAFVVLVAAMSVVGFMDEAMWLAYPELMTYLDTNPLLPLLWMSYAVFAGSWVYHAYIKGE